MGRIRAVALGVGLVLACASVARADATIFIGASSNPTNRGARGFAVGAGFLIVAFEFEYGSVSDDLDSGAPSLKTGMGNVLLQTPVPIFGFQPYFSVGGGVFHESIGSHSETNFAPNTGGGVKISLVGPLKLRVDYRVFRLGNGALYSPAHRIYAGLNIGF